VDITKGNNLDEETEVTYKVPMLSINRDRVYVIESGFKYGMVYKAEIETRLGRLKGISLRNLVVFHQPPNTEMLLRYIDRNLTTIEEEIRESKDWLKEM
jgi:hypothetical protein